jgi:hypothetical protein
MSRDGRKDLRLVKPHERVEPDALDPNQLRGATGALRAALDPGELAGIDHEAILALTLGDDVFEASAEERAEAAALARALDSRSGHPLADLAEALRACRDDEVLDGADHEALIALAVDPSAADAHPEQAAARALARALAGEATHPLAELATSLRHAGGGELAVVDGELLLALSTGDADFEHDRESPARLAAALEGHATHPLAELATSLRAARGGELAPLDGELLLAFATGDADVGGRERESADRLAAALAGEGSHPLAELATSLHAASSAAVPLGDLKHERILRTAIDRAARAVRRRADSMGRGAFIGAIVALAAGFALFVGSLQWLETRGGTGRMARGVVTEKVDLIDARSTLDLFDPAEPFPAKGGESERMEKIVASRASDLRNNRFSAWGVR